MNTFKNAVQTIIFLSVLFSALLSLSPVFFWTWAPSSSTRSGQPIIFILQGRGEVSSSPLQLYKCGDQYSSWSVLLPLPFLSALIHPCENRLAITDAFSSWQVTDILCLQGQSARHPFLIDITRTTTWRSPRQLHTFLHTWAGHGTEPVGIPGVQSTNYWLTGNSPDQTNQSVNYKGSYLDPGGLGAV